MGKTIKNMENTDAYPTVGWRTYLDPSKSDRVRKFIKLNGAEIFTKLYETIESATEDGQDQILVLVHPNVTSIVSISQEEFIEVLNHCIKYFESIQGYESCAQIVKIRKKCTSMQKVDN